MNRKLKTIFTGPSSFSGYWFIKTLCERGHQVVALFHRPQKSYTGVRAVRVEQLLSLCTPIFDLSFGSDFFFETLLSLGGFDVFCHHAAEVSNYKSLHFDPIQALKKNTTNPERLLQIFEKAGCERMILTGSVFEQEEGVGSLPLRAVSPYGLSKGLTSAFFSYYFAQWHLGFGKFVIPNPFGPLEEFKFTSFLASAWLKKEKPVISHPDYVRDNIHIELLAKAYALFVEELADTAPPFQRKKNPSQYIGTQRAFAERMAFVFRERWDLPCLYTCLQQSDFSEPRERVNTEPLDYKTLDFNEQQAWDQLSTYYLQTFHRS